MIFTERYTIVIKKKTFKYSVFLRWGFSTQSKLTLNSKAWHFSSWVLELHANGMVIRLNLVFLASVKENFHMNIKVFICFTAYLLFIYNISNPFCHWPFSQTYLITFNYSFYGFFVNNVNFFLSVHDALNKSSLTSLLFLVLLWSSLLWIILIWGQNTYVKM